MRTSILVIAFAALQFSVCAQDAPQKFKKFKVNVFHGKNKISSGFLLPLSDTVVRVVKHASAINSKALDNYYRDFHYSDINRITVTTKGAVGKGLLIGTLTGMTVGAMIGYMSGDDHPCAASSNDFFGIGYTTCESFRSTASEKAMFSGISGGAAGATLGICIGALAIKKFVIGRKKKAFMDMNASTHEWIYMKN